MTSGLTFAIATRDELRLRGRLVEQRLAHGIARHRENAIDANDARDDELVVRCDAEIADLRAAAPSDARVRLVATARRIDDVTFATATMTIGINGRFAVSDAAHAAEDLALLQSLGTSTISVDYRSLPIVWRNGSASVLLHEAVGHAAEHEHARLDWPSWLSVHDEPLIAIDDLGNESRTTDLLVGEAPSCFRRESFRDVPIRRMSQLVVRGREPFDLTEPCLEIHLLAGGEYEPLDETVTLHVAAAKLGDRWLAPFVLRESRTAIARSILGATGDPQRYPGVICSSEGQELAVGSTAPVLLTRFA